MALTLYLYTAKKCRQLVTCCLDAGITQRRRRFVQRQKCEVACVQHVASGISIGLNQRRLGGSVGFIGCRWWAAALTRIPDFLTNRPAHILSTQQLTRHLFARLQAIEGLRILGPTPEQQPDRGALAAFDVEGLHANDIAALLDSAGICIRSGHHCTQPLHRHYGLNGTARASLSFTTTLDEIDRFADELTGTIQFLRDHS
jgi:hypothetical protein